ncbi:MAG: PilZ domain-containing protein, partial [Ferrimicrobium sp.]
MEGSVALGALGYRGKTVELGWADSSVTRVIRHQVGPSIWVDGPLPEGPCEIRIAFLAEAYHGAGVIHREASNLGALGVRGVRGVERREDRASGNAVGADDERDFEDGGAFEGDWVVTVDGGLSLANERSAPRVPVELLGTYYLRPPSLGVPMRVIDVSVSGLALSPVAGESPEIAERRMISFSLEGREIKTVIEVVAIEADVWRGRFLRLRASDEEAIAGFVLARQVADRQALSLAEIRAVSTLDAVGRRGAPLLERVELEANTLTIVAGAHEVILPVVPRLLEQGDRCSWLAGR